MNVNGNTEVTFHIDANCVKDLESHVLIASKNRDPYVFKTHLRLPLCIDESSYRQQQCLWK